MDRTAGPLIGFARPQDDVINPIARANSVLGNTDALPILTVTANSCAGTGEGLSARRT